MQGNQVKETAILFRILSIIKERERGRKRRRGKKESRKEGRLFKRIVNIYKECKKIKFCQLARNPPASRL